jgi:hypothetical protein
VGRRQGGCGEASGSGRGTLGALTEPSGKRPEVQHGVAGPGGTVSGMPPPSLLVAEDDDGKFAVKVSDGRVGTSHLVSVPSGFGPDLGLGAISGEDLVRASFLFLLDREPATSILAEFSLDLIPRYFPEYRNEIRKYT